MSDRIEEANNLIGNRTRDLPARSTVPQQTTLYRGPDIALNTHIYIATIWRVCEYRRGMEGSARRKAATYTQNNTNIE
jgi:hypothetical protein